MRKLICVFMLLCIFTPGTVRADLAIHYLDVGQGDAAIVLCDSEFMIIDGGPSSASDFIYSYIRNTLELDFVDYVISTHPHEDHAGGIAAVLNAVPVDLILSPVQSWNTSVFDAVVRYADLQGTPIVVPEDGDILHLGGATVTVLHCWPDAWTVNDMSICIRIDYGNTSFLFTGDAEYMAEYMMLDSGLPLKADVLKVAHHGSSSSSTKEFLMAVDPDYAVISCGRENPYGHPHEKTLNSIRELNAALYRTDLQGTIVCTSDGNTLMFTTKRQSTEDLFEGPAFTGVIFDEE